MIEESTWGDDTWTKRGHCGDVKILWEHQGSEGSYEWSIVAIVRDDATNRYAVYQDGGCSCNFAYEDSPDKYFLEWKNDIREVISDARSAVGSASLFSTADCADSYIELGILKSQLRR